MPHIENPNLFTDFLNKVLPYAMQGLLWALLPILLIRFIAAARFPEYSLSDLARYAVDACARALKRWISGATWRLRVGERAPLERAWRASRVLLYILALLVVSRVAIFTLCWVTLRFVDGGRPDFGDVMGRLVIWDSTHYIKLAENGYVNVGDDRLLIVFYPLYPLLLAATRWIFLGNTMLAGIVTSNAMFVGACYLLYRLVAGRQGHRAALFAVFLLQFSPTSIFFSLPFSESLFLLLTLLAVTFADKRRFVFAVIAAALCSATRMLGLVAAVPVCFALARDINERALKQGRISVGRALRYFAGAALCASGFFAYLLLNWTVTGSPMTFLQIQASHWSQEFGSVAGTLKMTTLYAIAFEGDIASRLGIWVLQGSLAVILIVLLAVRSFREKPGDAAYTWVYLLLALSPTWLLSGGRYLLGMYTVYPMVTATVRRSVSRAVLAVFVLGIFALSCGIYVHWGLL